MGWMIEVRLVGDTWLEDWTDGCKDVELIDDIWLDRWMDG